VISVIVDTSVWHKFFSGRIGTRETALMSELLDQDDGVLCHSAVIGELVLGGLAIREEKLLERLPKAPDVTSRELLAFIRSRKLSRKGIGWSIVSYSQAHRWLVQLTRST
jgi:predicted nucleic acid-binding protein